MTTQHGNRKSGEQPKNRSSLSQSPKENGDETAKSFVTQKSLPLVRYLSSNHSDEWDSYTDDDESFIQSFPKIELHVHLDGSFDPHYLFDFLQQQIQKSPRYSDSVHTPSPYLCWPTEQPVPWDPANSPLPLRSKVQDCQTPKQYHQLCTCRGFRSLAQMLNCFQYFLPLVQGNLELLEKLAFDFVQRQWEQHVMYTEVRYSPHLLATQQSPEDEENKTGSSIITAEQVYQAVTHGLRRGTQQFGIKVNQILCAITWHPEWAEGTLELVQAHFHEFPCGVVGIDIASGEEHFDQEGHPELYQAHYDMIQKAKQLHIPITLHAGESTSRAQENVRTAIETYGAKRIGHGYRMVDQPELMTFVKERGCHVEVCLTSSDETGGWDYDEHTQKDWKQHPCVTMKQHGVPFSLSSDDPAVFHTSLAWQYRTAITKIGFDREIFEQTNLDAIAAAFLPEDEKKELREQVRRYCSNAHRRSFRRATSETFTDRVYLSNKQYL
ncbi:adenosine deaminase [Fistulifera solaris]|jgi:adenosine deaminase|uniref:Adenosine deaminase n=1 Tax=Fistulifera solaris TaxID=1519565 RepID=A0A1Z5KF45_FISSO|nr:adenosine deaminase [Fistulifera solaris]|eukprot:GAX24745.1 adenosine deaminase [Fistulifera solaris]